MNKKRNSLFIVIFIVLMIIPSLVYADFGPKDLVYVYVKNYPEGEYYLDLLQKDRGEYSDIDTSDHNPLLLEYLSAYEPEGWYPALARGTNIPLFGSLTGEIDNEYMKHSFSYFGVPSTYRIVIATADGATAYEEITRKSLHSAVTLDYETGEITYTPVWVGYLTQYISTFIPTIIIEGLILIFMGFSLKKNLRPFILTNAFTQIILTAVAGKMLITGGYTFSFLRFFPVEVVILIIEAIIYVLCLHGNDEKPPTHTKSRKMLYAVCANTTSWIVSLLFTKMQFTLIMNILM